MNVVFFKQKTAYEMRISDWSSDVCSSDLVSTRPCTSLAQPSISTNKSSLKGSEIVVGDSIIMPSASRMLATTMSITRNGRKIRKPIWNAAVSSLTVNAGTTTRKWSAVISPRCDGGSSRCALRRKNARSALLECCSKIGRAHVCTPVTNAHLVCRHHLEQKNT